MQFSISRIFRNTAAFAKKMKNNGDTLHLLPLIQDSDERVTYNTNNNYPNHTNNPNHPSNGTFENNTENIENERIPLWIISAMLAPAFAWGFVSTTMSLLTLPLESQRVAISYSHSQNGDSTSSIFLALFIFLAGLTQWLCPIIGKISDESVPILHCWGRRIPFIILGSILSIFSLLGMSLSSWVEQWFLYGLTFTTFMIGMNILYGCMYALIPDLIPSLQVGQANGLLAMQLVLGSLTGFSFFQACIAYNHSHMNKYTAVKMTVAEVYICYAVVLFISCLLASLHTTERTDEDSDINATHKISYTRPSEELNTFRPTLSNKTMKIFVVWKQAIIKASHITGKELFLSYRISPQRHGDFFYVTLSRTFYYMGISVQSFFLFYIHDILRHHSSLARESPQTIVSGLALLVQFSGVLTSYPAGYISDNYFYGERKPLIYWSCFFLSLGTFSLIFLRYLKSLEWICVVIGLANGGYLTMETSLAVDSLENMKKKYKQIDLAKQLQHEEHDPMKNKVEDKKEGAAQMLGIWGVASFVGKDTNRISFFGFFLSSGIHF